MDPDDYDDVTLESLNYVQPKGYGVIYLYTFDDGELYVGQTTRTLNHRHKQHLKGHIRVDYKMRSHDYSLSILAVVPKEELNDAEIHFIKELNTFEDGLNNTTGGNNFVMSEEIRQLMSEQKTAYLDEHPEAIEAFNERMRKFWEDPARHEWFSQLQKEFWSNEENRIRQSKTTSNYFATHPEDRERVSEFFKLFYSDPKNLDDMSRRSLELWNDQEYRKKTLEAQRKYREEHPELPKLYSERVKDYYRRNPDARKNLSEKQKKRWNDPEYKKKMSEVSRKRFEEDPSQRARMSERMTEHFSDLSEREKVSEKLKAQPKLDRAVIIGDYVLSPNLAQDYYQEGKLLPATLQIFRSYMAWQAWEKTDAFLKNF